MELLSTLRAQLDVLETYLDDATVHEILVAGPDRVFVTREGRSERVDVALPDRRIRSLADRLVRALGGRADRADVRSGRLSEDLEISIIGTPRAERCPVLRVHRRAVPEGQLSQLVQDGLLTTEAEQLLAECIESRSATVVFAPFGAPKEQVMAALTAAWHAEARVVALEAEHGPLSQNHAVDLTFPPSTGVEALMGAAPDVIVTMDPEASVWSGLLTAGRPFVVAVEAPNAAAGLERLVAMALTGDARMSRSAAEALVLSRVAQVVEMAPGRRLWVRRLARPNFVQGRLSLAVDVELPRPPEPVRPASLTLSAAQSPDLPPNDTSAFPAADLVEELSNEIAEAEASLRQTPVEPEASSAPEPEEVIEAAPSQPEMPAAPAVEERTLFGTDPGTPVDAGDVTAGQGSRPRSRTAGAQRRMASERMATVTGPPRPSEVASQVAHVLEELGEDASGVLSAVDSDLEAEAPAQEPLQDEVMTSHVVTPPNLDPFETQDGPFEPGPMDSTQAAEISEMLSSDPPSRAPQAWSIPAQKTVSRPQSRTETEESWDEDAPSELMQRPELSAEVPESEFEDEKTPVAPLFDSTNARSPRRPRRRPRSTPDPDRSEAPGDELGDPTRRRKDPPERPRARRRQRDRS